MGEGCLRGGRAKEGERQGGIFEGRERQEGGVGGEGEQRRRVSEGRERQEAPPPPPPPCKGGV